MTESRFDSSIEQRLNEVISLVSEAFFITRADFSKLIYVSDSWEKIFGTKKETLIKDPGSWMTAVLPEYVPMLQKETMEMIRTGEIPNNPIDFKIKWPDGSIHWVRGSVMPLKDKNGKVVEIAGVIGDVTAEKEAQEKLDNYTSTLKEEVLKRTKNLEEAQKIAKVGSWEWDVLNNKVTWSKELYDMFGITDDNTPRTYEDYLKLIHPEDRGRVKKVIDSAYAAKKSYKFECRIVKPNGGVFFHYGEGRVTVNERGEVIKMTGIGQDITERVETESKIKELSETRNKFIRIMSHQLRTPLTSINWNLETLLGGSIGELTSEQKQFIRISHDAMQKVTRRVDDLLIVIDIEEGRIVFDKQKTSLRSLWGSVMVEWRQQCEVKGLKCEYQASDKPEIDIEADPDKLRRAIRHLAENAAIYTPENGRITVKITERNNNIRFEITDTGVGIPKGEQSKVFTKFFRASNASTMMPDASGVGLAIAKYFIEQNGGKIGFVSEEGKGSTFWFELPTN